MHHYKIGDLQKSCAYFLHSVECYNKWGAFAVSRRVETTIESMFGSDLTQLRTSDDMLTSILTPQEVPSKKRS